MCVLLYILVNDKHFFSEIQISVNIQKYTTYKYGK